MKNTRMANILMVGALAGSMALSLVGCGGDSGKMEKTYILSQASYLDGISWYMDENYTLQLFDDGTYQLDYSTDIFGSDDLGSRGNRVIIYTGSYTVAESADGEASHQDVTLSEADRIYMEQHGKGWGHDTEIIRITTGDAKFDTAAWTDTMTSLYDPQGNTKGAEDFLTEFGGSFTVTVEDPSLVPEDTTLTYRLTAAPELPMPTHAAA